MDAEIEGIPGFFYPIKSNNMDQNNQEQRTLTFGERAVGITFNPGRNPEVEEIKRACANAIDVIHGVREKTEDGEVKAQCTLAIRQIQQGQMWGVKAATWNL